MEIVGGYRLVRKLGSGARAEVYLGHAARRQPPLGQGSAGAAGRADWGGPNGRSETVAIKVYRQATRTQGIDIEVEALGRASSRHLLELRDLATGPDGRPALILGRLEPRSLARLFVGQTLLDAGETVTLLAPIAGAVAELHRVGVAHGAIRPSSVLFDEAGAPVLAAFGHAALIGRFPSESCQASLTPGELMAEPCVANDLACLAQLSRSVLDRTRGMASLSVGRQLTAWLALDAFVPTERFPRELEERLFDLAEPLPLSTLVGPVAAPAGVASGGAGAAVSILPTIVPRIQAEQAPPAGGGLTPPRGGGLVSRVAGRRRELFAPGGKRAEGPGIDELGIDRPEIDRPEIDRPEVDRLGIDRSGMDRSGMATAQPPETIAASGIGPVMARVARALSAVRRPVWVAAGLAAALLVVALVAVPRHRSGAPDGGSAAVAASQTRSPFPSEPLPQAPGSSAAPVTAGGVSGGVSGAVSGDDPVAAARDLIRARLLCIRHLSVPCLDSTDQAGSAAIEDDRELIRSMQRGAKTSHDGSLPVGDLSLVQRLGDSALVSVGPPDPTRPDERDGSVDSADTPVTVSLLLVQTITGWRIRDVLIG